MPLASPAAAARAFIALAGPAVWRARLARIAALAADGRRSGQAVRQRHLVELTLARLARGGADPSPTEARIAARIAALAGETALLAARLTPAGRVWFDAALDAALDGDGTPIGLLHLARTARRHRAHGFTVRFAGFEDGAPFDLLLTREGAVAELVCDVVSAESGRAVSRAAWLLLADRIDPDLQTWLAAHPGQYLLKMTLPDGLAGGLPADPSGVPAAASDPAALAALHGRIRAMLAGAARATQDAAVVLRLDPLLLAGARSDLAPVGVSGAGASGAGVSGAGAAEAGANGIMARLRREFGPEAHLAAIAADGGMFVLAARAGQEDRVAGAVRARLAALAPARLTGTRPGILAMFLEDTDRAEWRGLRERLELEGEARQFLTGPEARAVVAVTCASRLELFGLAPPDAAEEGELRFRNPGHPAARVAALAPAVASAV